MNASITRVADIDWNTWQPEETATLMFVTRDDQVLLIRKKRGLGAGKINGPGGRIEQGETPLECAIRETREELLITPQNVRPAGELFFHAEDMPKIHGHVFTATDFEGTPAETDEAIPLWTPVDRLPLDEMWDDDRLWLPQVLAGCSIRGWFTFVGERLIDHRIEIADADASDRQHEDARVELASPACFLHEVDPAYSGLPPDGDTPPDDAPA